MKKAPPPLFYFLSVVQSLNSWLLPHLPVLYSKTKTESNFENDVRLTSSLVFGHVFQNNIPVFSPALTDGAIGDLLYLFSAHNPGLLMDIIEGISTFISVYLTCPSVVGWPYTIPLISDVTKLNTMAVSANSTGIIVLGGGVAKHHVCNANSWVSVFHNFFLSIF